MKVLVLRLARVLGLFAMARFVTRRQLKILCYHGIWIGPPPHYGDCLYMAAHVFEGRMEWLAREGYRVLTLDEGLRRLQEGRLGSRDLVITIDDAWYGTWLHMLPALQRHAFPSTLYVPTRDVVSQEPVLSVLVRYLLTRSKTQDALATLLPAEPQTDRPRNFESRLLDWISSLPDAASRREGVRKAAAALGIAADPLLDNRVFGHMNGEELVAASAMGTDIQLHTHTHSMHGMDPAAVGHEIEVNRAYLSGILDRPATAFRHFCYPSGEHHESIRRVLRDCHIDSATTTEPGLVSRGQDRWAMNRILDCQSLSIDELEARLCGFWGLPSAWQRSIRWAR